MIKTALRRVAKTLTVLLIVFVGLLIWKRGEIKRLLAVNSLFSEEKIVHNFSHMSDVFFHQTLTISDTPMTPLPLSAQDMPAEMESWITARSLTAIVVLKDGNIAYENYFQGTNAEDLRISWSMAKSYLSALLGILLEEGAIGSIDDPVIQYAPELAKSGYADATIRNVLNMSSGVEFDEDYLKFSSDINKMGRVLAMGGSMDGFSVGITGTIGDPGAAWRYVSIDTHVIGMVIRGATGRSIHDLMAEKLLAPMGLEQSPVMLTDGNGVAFVLGGLNMRTRDYARMGLMFLQNGMLNGQQIVPAAWVAQSTRASAPTKDGQGQYGFQWWLAADARQGEYFARGIYGQYIYVNTSAGVVVAINSADRSFREAGSYEQNLSMFRTLAAALN